MQTNQKVNNRKRNIEFVLQRMIMAGLALAAMLLFIYAAVRYNNARHDMINSVFAQLDKQNTAAEQRENERRAYEAEQAAIERGETGDLYEYRD